MTVPDRGTGNERRVVGSERVLSVLKELARHPDGVSLDLLTRSIASPKSTVHRALSSLRRAGLADQDSRGQYHLGDEMLRMAFAYHEARPDHLRFTPLLQDLARRFGETAHYAVLDGAEIVYRAKVDPTVGAARLTSTVGGRNPAHTTAVGKLLLASRLGSVDEVVAWIGARQLERRTPQTKTTAEQLHSEFELVRSRAYSVDDQENEMGVNCLALPIFAGPIGEPTGAVSISALAYRTPLPVLVEAVDEIRSILGELSRPPPDPATDRTAGAQPEPRGQTPNSVPAQ